MNDSKKEITALNEKDIEAVSGGFCWYRDSMSNMSFDDAVAEAKKIGHTCYGLNGSVSEDLSVRFMRKWREDNKDNKEYLDHKDDVDRFIDPHGWLKEHTLF